jgi:uncharacterized protein (TIGR03067 family)
VESVLEGTWQMIRAEQAGETAPELVVSQMSVRLAAGAYEVIFGGEVSDRGTYQETAATAWRTLILHGVVGPNAGRSIPCIFQLMGDRLRVCYGLDGVLPVEFATREGDRRYLAVYRRVAGSGA